MNRILLYLIPILFLSACTAETVEQTETESDLMKITKEQFQSENMHMGKPQKNLIEEKITFTGKIVPLNNGTAIVNAPLQGIVKEILVQDGQMVNVNTPLLRVYGTPLIELQENFATSSARIKQLKANYDRVKKLYEESIKTENEFLLAESDYRSELARYKALELKLKQIAVDPTLVEEGEFASTYSILSPMKGQVNNLTIKIGQFVSLEDQIAELVNKEKVELELSLFENNRLRLMKGQKLNFTGIGDPKMEYSAFISRIGSKINDETKVLNAYAKIDDEVKETFAVNQMVKGEVIIASDSLYSVPRSAVLKEGTSYFVFLISPTEDNAYLLTKQKVKTGKFDTHFIELLDFNTDWMILLEGFENMTIE